MQYQYSDVTVTWLVALWENSKRSNSWMAVWQVSKQYLMNLNMELSEDE